MAAAQDWKERTRLLLGDGMLSALENASVAVIGVGGVGGYAAEMLVRAGVGNMIILDADTVSLSNRNRQLLALGSTLGRKKCSVLAERLLDINPELKLTVIEEFLEPEASVSASSAKDGGKTPAALLGGLKIDFLVDAIDTLAPKLTLIKYCVDNGIPHVSSMGAGAKYDVTKIRIADISASFCCPLAYIVRKRLRHMGIKKGFKVVFSEEIPDSRAIVPAEERNKRSQVGTVSYLPAAFGCACAQVALQHFMSEYGTADE